MDTTNVLKTLKIAQALDHEQFSWNPNLPEDMRQPLQDAALNRALEKKNAELILEGDELKVYAKGTREAVYDESGYELTLNRLVKSSFTGLGSFQAGSQIMAGNAVYTSDDRSTPKVTDPATGVTTWHDYQGRKHTQIGSTTYVSEAAPALKPLDDPRKEAQRRLEKRLREL